MAVQFENGLGMRKQVMGDAFVERAFAQVDAFTAPLQDFVTRNAWGTTWCRDGLDLKTRSLATLAMLTALGRAQELRGHVRGAVNNGASMQEIQEVLLHAAVYCGMPLAIDAFRSAHEVLKEMVENHATYTDSEKAKALLADWDNAVDKFVKVYPREFHEIKEIEYHLAQTGLTGSELEMETFEKAMRTPAAEKAELIKVGGK